MHRSPSRSRRAGLGLTAALLAFGLIAAACGSDDSEGGSDTTAGGGAGTTAGGAGTTAAGSELTPVQGGKLVVGIEADTGSPWMPSKFTCAAVVLRHDRQRLRHPHSRRRRTANWTPYLAESVTPNEDYTVWTIKAREGVTFHDGTPFDGAAMVDNLTRQFNSFLTGKVFSDVATNPDGTPQIVLTDPMTVDDHDEAPWVVLPDLPRCADRHDREPDVDGRRRRGCHARAEAGRHRSVHLQGLQAGRVVHRDTQPELLEPAVPVPRRVRDPRHPRRADTRRGARGRRRRPHPHDERRHHREVPRRSPRTSRCSRRPTTARSATRCCT